MALYGGFFSIYLLNLLKIPGRCLKLLISGRRLNF